MSDAELIKSLIESKHEAILAYESICEQLVLDNFSDEVGMKIQTLVLDRAQAIYEAIIMEERLIIINNDSDILLTTHLLKKLKINYKYYDIGRFYIHSNDIPTVADALVSNGIRFI